MEKLCFPSQIVTLKDITALMALYNATDGDNWINNTNWGTVELIDSWYGITVTGNRVTQIDLSSNELKGYIPPQIANLDALTHLCLGNNQISGPIPPEIKNLGSLIYLYWGVYLLATIIELYDKCSP